MLDPETPVPDELTPIEQAQKRLGMSSIQRAASKSFAQLRALKGPVHVKWDPGTGPAAHEVPDTGEADRIRLGRFRGAMLGLAVGDALGAPLEGRERGSVPRLEDMTGGGMLHLLPGQWTDDTAQALCFAESLVQCGRFDERDQLERLVRWLTKGHLSSTGYCVGIGRTSLQALRQFMLTGEPSPGPSPSNGSLMRLAPIALAFSYDPQLAAEMSARSSLITHSDPRAVDACRYLGLLIAEAVNGAPKEELLSATSPPLLELQRVHPLHPEIAAIAAGSFKDKMESEIQAWGHVVQTLEAGLWAFHHADSFRAGCITAVNLCQDADTVGAVFGQLAGAHYGSAGDRGIPGYWQEQVALRSTIEGFGDGLAELASALKTGPTARWRAE